MSHQYADKLADDLWGDPLSFPKSILISAGLLYLGIIGLGAIVFETGIAISQSSIFAAILDEAIKLTVFFLIGRKALPAAIGFGLVGLMVRVTGIMTPYDPAYFDMVLLAALPAFIMHCVSGIVLFVGKIKGHLLVAILAMIAIHYAFNWAVL